MSILGKGLVNYDLLTGAGKDSLILDPSSDVLPCGRTDEPMTQEQFLMAEAYRRRQLLRLIPQEEAEK